MPLVWIVLAFVMALAGCRDTVDRKLIEKDEPIEPVSDDTPPGVQGLLLVARPLEEVVPAEGPLLVEAVVYNMTDSIVRFRPIFNIGGFLSATIIGHDGLPVPETATIDPPNALPVLLQPGESHKDTTDLRCDVPNPDRSSCGAPYDLSRPGRYEIKLRFALPCDPAPCRDSIVVEAESFTVLVQGGIIKWWRLVSSTLKHVS